MIIVVLVSLYNIIISRKKLFGVHELSERKFILFYFMIIIFPFKLALNAVNISEEKFYFELTKRQANPNQNVIYTIISLIIIFIAYKSLMQTRY